MRCIAETGSSARCSAHRVRVPGSSVAGPWHKGFSLVELLVACALLSLLLLTATGMSVQARRLATASDDLTHQSQVEELASRILSYHLGLAGYGGVDGEAAELGGPGLELGRGEGQGGGDVVVVRYLEERWFASPQVRELTFDVKRDGRGQWNLYRTEPGATRQPAVAGVSGLRLTGFLTSGGTLLPPGTPLPVRIVGLELELAFEWGVVRRVFVPVRRALEVQALAGERG